MRRILALALFVCLGAVSAEAHSSYNGICEQAARITTQGNSNVNLQKSYLGCTVTVYQAGTITLASLTSDSGGITPLANPFTASTTTGRFTFYAANGAYDVKLSGAGLPAPFTIGGIFLWDPLDLPNVTLGNIIVTSCSGCGGGGGGGSPTGPAGGDLTGTYPNPTIAANAVTYSKFQQVSASRLLGRQPGSAGNVQEITLGTNLSLTGTTLNATGGTSVTGAPLSGNLTQFSGPASITNGNLSGDVTTTGTLATTIGPNVVTYPKIQQQAADTLLGRGDGAGTGNVQPITLGACLAMSGTTLSGTCGGGGGGTINGTATANQISYGVSPNTIGSTSTLTYDPATGRVVDGADISFTSQKLLVNLDPTSSPTRYIAIEGLANATTAGNQAIGVFGSSTSSGATNINPVMVGTESESYHQSSGVAAVVVGAGGYVENSVGGGTITEAVSLEAWQNLALDGGTITNNYGLYVQDQNAGATNYSIYTNNGQVRFGDVLNMSGNAAYNVQGVSSTGTQAKNLAGTCTLVAGTCTITFTTAEPDTSYRIGLAGNASEGFSWNTKLVGGFTIQSSNASSTAIVDWHLFR